MGERDAVGFGQIHHVQVVADAGAIGCWVVLPEDPQLVPASCSHLGDEGKQVVGNAEGVLPDAAAGVGAHRVEVAQAGHPPATGAAKCSQHLLHGEFGLGIGMHRRGGHALMQGKLLRFAVHGGGAAEHKGSAAMPFHGRRQDSTAVEVYIPVAQRVGHRFTHGFEPGEVNHAIHWAARAEGSIQHLRVAQIPFHQLKGIGRRQLLNPAQGFRTAVTKVVHYHQRVSLLQQHQAGVAADETSPSGDQDSARHGRGRRVIRLWIRSEPDKVFAPRVRQPVINVWTAERRFPS